MIRLISAILFVVLAVGCTPKSSANPSPEPKQVTYLSFVAPTENTDGSSLTNLLGFKVYYRNYDDPNSQLGDPNSIPFLDPSLTTIQLIDLGLPDGNYWIAITAVNSNQLESAYSNEVMVKVRGGTFYNTPTVEFPPKAVTASGILLKTE